MGDKDFFREIKDIDKVIHEPSRLAIMAVLYGVEEGDFKFLLNMTGLSKGNLSAHVSKLENAGYIKVEKKFVGKKPLTLYSITEKGRSAFEIYLKNLERITSKITGKN